MNLNYKVYVVDDDQAVSDAIARLVRSMGFESETYACAEDFLGSFNWTGMECVILDVRMPGMSGLQVLKKFFNDGIKIPVIILTGHGDIPMAIEALKLGAVDFIEKPFREQDMWNRIKKAFKTSEDYRVQKTLIEKIKNINGKEATVLKYLMAGFGDKEIGVKLGCTRRTAANYRTEILEKLHVQNLIELANKIGKYGITV